MKQQRLDRAPVMRRKIQTCIDRERDFGVEKLSLLDHRS